MPSYREAANVAALFPLYDLSAAWALWAREMGVGGGVGVYIVFSLLSIHFYPNSH